MDNETYETLKRLIYFLHHTLIKEINRNDVIKIRDWIDEVAKEYED